MSSTQSLGNGGLTSPQQRCDGKRPCTTCVVGGRGARCTYEPRQRSRRANTNPFFTSRNSAPRPLSIYTLASKSSAVEFSSSESQTRPLFNISLPTRSNSGGSTSFLPPLLTPRERPPIPTTQLPREPSSDVLVVRNMHNTMGCVPHSAVPPFTVLPSIHFRTILRPLQVPLSHIPPECMQISSIAGGDLDMTLYVFFGLCIFDGL